MSAAEDLGERVGVAAACRGLGVARATLYRRRAARMRPRPQQPRPRPARALGFPTQRCCSIPFRQRIAIPLDFKHSPRQRHDCLGNAGSSDLSPLHQIAMCACTVNVASDRID